MESATRIPFWDLPFRKAIMGRKEVASCALRGSCPNVVYLPGTHVCAQFTDPAPKKYNTPSHPFRIERGMDGAQRFILLGQIKKQRIPRVVE
jgi:hypothetical protein